jgi:hypothetical protein
MLMQSWEGEYMLPDFVAVHRRALTALDALSPSEHECLAAKFSALQNLPAEEWNRQGVRQAKPPVYVMQVTNNLLVFFSALPENRFLIQDFVRQETLDRFFAQEQKPLVATRSRF